MVSVFGGYALARFDFPGRDVLFLLTLAILMVPHATVLIPLYVMLHGVGLQNSLIGRSEPMMNSNRSMVVVSTLRAKSRSATASRKIRRRKMSTRGIAL